MNDGDSKRLRHATKKQAMHKTHNIKDREVDESQYTCLWAAAFIAASLVT